jgi:hypothetical protein
MACLPTQKISPLIFRLVVVFIVIGRALPTLTAATPSGDGALFYVMTRDIQTAGQIPLYTSFNGGLLPFVYPPGALIFTALMTARGWNLDNAFRLLPLTYFILLTLFMFPFAQRFGCRLSAATIAALMFAAADPLPFQQLIGGGGVVRGLGFILALLTWNSLDTMLNSHQHRIRTGLLAGLAMLCHPSNAAFIPLVALAIWSETRTRRGLRDLVFAGLTATVICLPYLLIALRHGIEPFIRVMTSMSMVTVHNDGLSYFVFTVAGHKAPYFWSRLLAPLAVIGMGREILHRDFTLPIIFALLLCLPGQAYQVSWLFALLCGLGAQVCIEFLSKRFSLFSQSYRWLSQL